MTTLKLLLARLSFKSKITIWTLCHPSELPSNFSFGLFLINHRFFYLEPDAKRIFGFPDSMDPLSDEVRKDKRFLRHAKYFVQMIDRALSLLGPEAEMLSEIFIELGGKHSRYGIKPEFFPSMGRALMESISNNLQDGEFTPAIKDDWIEVYHAMSFHMIRGHRIAMGEKV